MAVPPESPDPPGAQLAEVANEDVVANEAEVTFCAQLLVPKCEPEMDPESDPVIPAVPLTNKEPVMVTSPAFDINKLILVTASSVNETQFEPGIKYVFALYDLKIDAGETNAG